MLHNHYCYECADHWWHLDGECGEISAGLEATCPEHDGTACSTVTSRMGDAEAFGDCECSDGWDEAEPYVLPSAC